MRHTPTSIWATIGTVAATATTAAGTAVSDILKINAKPTTYKSPNFAKDKGSANADFHFRSTPLLNSKGVATPLANTHTSAGIASHTYAIGWWNAAIKQYVWDDSFSFTPTTNLPVPGTKATGTLFTIVRKVSIATANEVPANVTQFAVREVAWSGANGTGCIIAMSANRVLKGTPTMSDTPTTLAPAGYWGVAYNHLTYPFTTIIPPTADEILALAEYGVLYEITGDMCNMAVNFEMNEDAWRAATGLQDADEYPFWMEASGRAFFITQDWGTPLSIIRGGIDVLPAFTIFSVEINGVMYTGLIASGAPPQYEGMDYQFTFV
jgi:hypothetical protein